MVNIAGSRLVLNLKGFSATRSDVDFLSGPWSSSPSAATFGRSNKSRTRDDGLHVEISSETISRDLDLEMYSIERGCQQLGTKLLR